MTDFTEPIGLDIGRVIQDTFSVLGRHFVTFVTLSLILVGLPSALLGVVQVQLIGAKTGPLAILGPALYVGLLGSLVAVVASFVLQAAIISGAAADLNGRPVSVGECLRIGLRALLPLIGLSLLLGVAVGIGTVLLVIPGLLMALAWCVTIPVYVVEQKGMFASIGRSAELTKRSRFGIFGLLFLLSIVYVLVLIIVGVVVGNVSQGGPDAYVKAALVQPLATVMLSALSATMSAVLYMELRRVREGAGPEALAAMFA